MHVDYDWSTDLVDSQWEASRAIPRAEREPYKSTAARLRKAITSLRGVERLKLGGSDYGDVAEQELTFYEIFSAAFPRVSSLEVRSQLYPFSYLSHFPKLKHLALRGWAMSTPDETLSALKFLPSLDSIPLSNYKIWDTDRFLRRVPIMSFTPMVLAQINPLTSFSIYEEGTLSMILTVSMIKSLHAHTPTLRNLTIGGRGLDVPKELLVEILNFISSSQLTKLFLTSKISNRLRNTDFQFFLPKVTANKIVTVCEVQVHRKRDHKKLLKMRWECLPKALGHQVESKHKPDSPDRARAVIESEESSGSQADIDSENLSGDEAWM